MGLASDTDGSTNKKKGLIHIKSIWSLNIDNEETDNLELFENDEKVRKIEMNLKKVMGGINRVKSTDLLQ